jgi:hypothetical protein
MKNNKNYLEITKIIFNNKKVFIVFLTLGILFSIIYIKFKTNYYSALIKITPLNLIEFNNNFPNQLIQNNSTEKSEDNINKLEITPLSLYYGYLNVIKNIKTKEKDLYKNYNLSEFEELINNTSLKWDWDSPEHQLTITVRKGETENSIIYYLTSIIKISNNIYLSKIKDSFNNQINIIDQKINILERKYINEKSAEYKEFTTGLKLKKEILINEKSYYENKKTINFDFYSIKINTDKFSNLKIFILSIGSCFILSILFNIFLYDIRKNIK